MSESERWLKQAKIDLENAEWNAKGRFYAQACFLSQQAAEKALKAVLYKLGKRKILTHSTFTLSTECSEHFKEFKEIKELCAALDKHYVLSRYPNSIPDGIPHDIYTEKEASDSISKAKQILDSVEKTLREIEHGKD
jgi:HEPN domain-containing protein